MSTFEEPTFYLDLDHSLNRATIESAKLGQRTTVLVKAKKSGPSIQATGIRHGGEFHVEVTTDHGMQSHTWTWEFLADALRAYRN